MGQDERPKEPWKLAAWIFTILFFTSICGTIYEANLSGRLVAELNNQHNISEIRLAQADAKVEKYQNETMMWYNKYLEVAENAPKCIMPTAYYAQQPISAEPKGPSVCRIKSCSSINDCSEFIKDDTMVACTILRGDNFGCCKVMDQSLHMPTPSNGSYVN